MSFLEGFPSRAEFILVTRLLAKGLGNGDAVERVAQIGG